MNGSWTSYIAALSHFSRLSQQLLPDVQSEMALFQASDPDVIYEAIELCHSLMSCCIGAQWKGSQTKAQIELVLQLPDLLLHIFPRVTASCRHLVD